MPHPSYTTIIVGAGSAGCTLANRLTEDPDVRVLVLEAGGWDSDPLLHVPLAWARIFLRRMHDWGYETEPEPRLGNRRIECARGKVVGGSSATNALAYVRGHRGDYDRWAAGGLPTWSFAHVLPYFRRQESWEGGASLYRGGDGPLTTCYSRYQDPLTDALLEAARAAGHPRTPDYNGAQQEGFGRWQLTVRNGRRCSAAVAHLRPARRRGGADVQANALATRIIIEAGRAVGVEYLRNGQRRTAYAEREVILAGGVINSPQLLMLSGIGDPGILRAHGITVRIPLPGVGRNLQDHLSAMVAYARTQPGPIHAAMRADRLTLELARSWMGQGRISAESGAPAMAFLKTSPEQALPDVQLFFVGAPLTAGPYFSPFVRPYQDGFSCRAVLLRPGSRGHVTLASADPLTPPRIAQNFLATLGDTATLRAGLRLARAVCAQAPMRPFIARELTPGPGAWTDAGLDAHIAATAITVHHPLGTCRMGRPDDALAVVDADLRVHGVDRLHVVDASVMPDMVGGNINAAVMMIAERAADIIRGRKQMDPACV